MNDESGATTARVDLEIVEFEKLSDFLLNCSYFTVVEVKWNVKKYVGWLLREVDVLKEECFSNLKQAVEQVHVGKSKYIVAILFVELYPSSVEKPSDVEKD